MTIHTNFNERIRHALSSDEGNMQQRNETNMQRKGIKKDELLIWTPESGFKHLNSLVVSGTSLFTRHETSTPAE